MLGLRAGGDGSQRRDLNRLSLPGLQNSFVLGVFLLALILFTDGGNPAQLSCPKPGYDLPETKP